MQLELVILNDGVSCIMKGFFVLFDVDGILKECENRVDDHLIDCVFVVVCKIEGSHYSQKNRVESKHILG